MYAIVEERNQSFRAIPGQRVQIPFNSELEAGSSITFDQVCAVTGENAQFGAPFVSGASVTGTVIGTVQGPKVEVAKFRRRKNSRTRTGFRARYTEVRIDSINL